ncbi:MAG: hypothetical protein AB8U25_01675 [Rickettsiales endosymbiont of Dermacentor nuttalli]
MIAYNLDKSSAAGIVSFIFLGIEMLFGGPLLALFNKKLGSYTYCFIWAGYGCNILHVASSYISSIWIIMLLFFVVGIMCCYQVIVFSASTKLVDPKSLSITVAFLNSINMFGGLFFHTIIGMIMERDSVSVAINNVQSYEYALSIISIC